MSKPFLFLGSPTARHMSVVISYRHMCMKGTDLTEIEKVGVEVFEPAGESEEELNPIAPGRSFLGLYGLRAEGDLCPVPEGPW